jgi:hypothetical protein
MIYLVNDSDFFKKINGLKEQVKANKPRQTKNDREHDYKFLIIKPTMNMVT